jgi:hypothetical protein
LTSGQVAAARGFTSQLDKAAAARSGGSTAEALPELVITDEILADFKEYLRSHNIEFAENDINKSKDFIGRRIKQEVFTSSFGLQEGYKIRVQGDMQVLKALEVLPEAKLLMTSGRTKPAMQNRIN